MGQYIFSRCRKISWKSQCEMIAKKCFKRVYLRKICSVINQNYSNVHENNMILVQKQKIRTEQNL